MAQCTEEVCHSLLEETLDVAIAYLVEEVLDAQLQQIHKFIKRCVTLAYLSICFKVLSCLMDIQIIWCVVGPPCV